MLQIKLNCRQLRCSCSTDSLYWQRLSHLAQDRRRLDRALPADRLSDGLRHRARARRRWRNMLLMLVILPFWTSFLLRVYAWIGILKNNGVHQQLPDVDWASSTSRCMMLQTDFAVYIGIVYSYLPFMILPLYANLEKLDHDAARGRGRPRLPAAARRSCTITLPLSMPGIIAGSHAGVHPGGRRVRDPVAARRPGHADDRQACCGTSSSTTATGRWRARWRSRCCCCW